MKILTILYFMILILQYCNGRNHVLLLKIHYNTSTKPVNHSHLWHLRSYRSLGNSCTTDIAAMLLCVFLCIELFRGVCWHNAVKGWAAYIASQKHQAVTGQRQLTCPVTVTWRFQTQLSLSAITAKVLYASQPTLEAQLTMHTHAHTLTRKHMLQDTHAAW